MCVVSMIGDHYRDKWRDSPWITPYTSPYQVPQPEYPLDPPSKRKTVAEPPISKEEFDALKREVEDLKKLLERAKEYDARNGEPECETDEKMEVLRKVAELVGVDLDSVIGRKQ
jgi:hypothetical protein